MQDVTKTHVRKKVYSVMWGWNDSGRCGNVVTDSLVDEPSISQKSVNKSYVSIAGGFDHTAMLSNDGAIYVIGRNENNQLGLVSNIVPILRPKKNKKSNTRIKDEGHIRNESAMFQNDLMSVTSMSQTSLSLTSAHLLPPNLQSCAAAYYHSQPQAVVPTGSCLELYGIRKDIRFAEVSCGHSFSLAREISHNEIDYLCRDLYRFQHTLNSFYEKNKSWLKTCTPLKYCLSGIIQQEKFTMRQHSQSRLHSWGTGHKGELGRGRGEHNKSIRSPELVPFPSIYESCFRYKSLDNLSTSSNNKRESSAVYMSGDSHMSSTSVTSSSSEWCYQELLRNYIHSKIYATQVSAGAHHVLAVVNYGRGLYSWGDNTSGQLGHGDDINRERPTPVDLSQMFRTLRMRERRGGKFHFRVYHCAAGRHHSAFIFQYTNTNIIVSTTATDAVETGMTQVQAESSELLDGHLHEQAISDDDANSQPSQSQSVIEEKKIKRVRVRSLVACFGRGTSGQLGLGRYRSVNVPTVLSEEMWPDSVPVRTDDFVFDHISCGARHTVVCGHYKNPRRNANNNTSPSNTDDDDNNNEDEDVGGTKQLITSVQRQRLPTPGPHAYLASSATPISSHFHNHNKTKTIPSTTAAGTAETAGTAGTTVKSAVLCWGEGTYGQLGHSQLRNECRPVHARLSEQAVWVEEVSAGVSWTLARTNTGHLYSWGRHNHISYLYYTILYIHFTLFKIHVIHISIQLSQVSAIEGSWD